MNRNMKSLGMLILIGISLALNAWLLSRGTSVSGKKLEIATPPVPAVETESITITQAPVSLGKTSFEWAVLESTDYPQYATNLRSFGCPEPLVKTILQRDIYGYYLDLRSKELAPLLSSFWDLTTNDLDDSRSIVRADIKEAEATVNSLLEELLHAHREDPILTRIRRQTAKINDVRLGFLPPNVRDQLIQIERRQDATNSSISKEQQIAQLLTPSELQEYRLRSSLPAIRSLLNTSYVDAPPASLKEIVARYSSESGSSGNVDRSKLKEIVRSVIGDQAAQIYELSYSRDYKTIYAVTQQAQQDSSVAIAIYSIQQETRKLLADQPDSAAAIIVASRRQVSNYVAPEQVNLLFDRLHFPNL